jgi:hypothetical protein
MMCSAVSAHDPKLTLSGRKRQKNGSGRQSRGSTPHKSIERLLSAARYVEFFAKFFGTTYMTRRVTTAGDAAAKVGRQKKVVKRKFARTSPPIRQAK